MYPGIRTKEALGQLAEHKSVFTSLRVTQTQMFGLCASISITPESLACIPALTGNSLPLRTERWWVAACSSQHPDPAVCFLVHLPHPCQVGLA